MNLFKMAFKNILRSKRRALRTFAVLVMGVAIFIFYGLLMDGFVDQAAEGTIDEETSHIRIRKGGFDEDMPLIKENLWYEPSSYLDNIDNIAYTARTTISAEVDNYENTLSVILMGVDPESDSDVFTLSTTSEEILEDVAWVGVGVVKDLGLDVGDYINITFRNMDDAFISAEYEIGGLLNSSNPMLSDGSVAINIHEMQEMIGNNFISYYSVKILDNSDLEETATDIRALYEEGEVLTWKDLNKGMEEIMDMKNLFMIPFYLIIALITFLGLTNSILISVWEKRRTTGTLRALGFYDKEIMSIFIYEAFWIAFIGTLAGVILGVLINIPMSTIGYNYAAMTETGKGGMEFSMYVPPVIKSTWNMVYILSPLIVVPIASMIVSLIPARKSIKMTIVDCIRNKD